MELKDVVGSVATIGGMIFGFGWQGSTIAHLRRDTNGIARRQREEITPFMIEIRERLARIEQDLIHIKQK